MFYATTKTSGRLNKKRKIYYRVVIKVAPSVVISVYSFLDLHRFVTFVFENQYLAGVPEERNQPVFAKLGRENSNCIFALSVENPRAVFPIFYLSRDLTISACTDISTAT